MSDSVSRESFVPDYNEVNRDPIKYVIYYENKGETDPTDIVVPIDCSGSMQQSEDDATNAVDTLPENTTVVPYGCREHDYHRTAYPPITTSKNWVDKHLKEKKKGFYMEWPWSTHVFNIRQYLIKLDKPVWLFLICDGAFDDSFAEMLQEVKNKLHFVKGITLNFVPHTRQKYKDSLREDLSRLIENLGRQGITIELYMNTLSPLNPSTQFQVREWFDKIPTHSLSIPFDYKQIGPFLAVHKHMTSQKVADILMKLNQKVVEGIRKTLAVTVKHTPQLLNDAKQSFCFLHKIMKVLSSRVDLKKLTEKEKEICDIARDYINKLSAYKKDNANGSSVHQRLIHDEIDKLLKAAQLDDSMEKLYEKMIDVSEFLLTVEKVFTPEDVSDALNDGSFGGLSKLLNEYLPNIIRAVDSKRSIPISFDKGISAEEIISMLFYPIGNYPVKGSKIIFVTMMILTVEAELDPVLIELATKVIIGNPKFFQMLGIDLESKEIDIPPNFYSYTASKMLYKLFKLFPEITDIIPDDFREEVVEEITSLYNAYSIRNAIAYMLQNKIQVVREELHMDSEKQDKTKGLAFIKPWEGMPWSNMPNLVYVDFDVVDDKGRFKCYYLDGTSTIKYKADFKDVPDEKDDHYYVHPNNLTMLSYGKPPEDLWTSLYEEQNPLREVSPDEEYNKDKLILREKTILNHIKKHTTVVKIPKSISLTPEIISECIGLDSFLKEKLQLTDLISHKSVSKETIKKMIPFKPNNNDFPKGHVIAGELYDFPYEELEKIYTLFVEQRYASILAGMGSKQRRLEMCTICFEDCSGKELSCGHSFHQECIDELQSPYTPGDFIATHKHKCPNCADAQECNKDKYPHLHTYLETKDLEIKDIVAHDFVLVLRHCEGCSKVFVAGNKECGGDLDQMGTKCSDCSIHNKIRGQCPGCGEGFVLREGDCNATICICGQAFCARCKVTEHDGEEFTEKDDVYDHIYDSNNDCELYNPDNVE